jgi:hypothetical protein
LVGKARAKTFHCCNAYKRNNEGNVGSLVFYSVNVKDPIAI